ncbi:hypothetical protein [Thermithiobacillus plumbiphilus]|uniref:Uncharacterized protein n=1 Tax=Thermithiobacillus plumbiphilus TaxID=1729899 RepID=A0ABU9D9F4_9PROT
MARTAYPKLSQEKYPTIDPKVEMSAAEAKKILDYLDTQDYAADAALRINVAEFHQLLSCFVSLYVECKQAQEADAAIH